MDSFLKTTTNSEYCFLLSLSILRFRFLDASPCIQELKKTVHNYGFTKGLLIGVGIACVFLIIIFFTFGYCIGSKCERKNLRVKADNDGPHTRTRPNSLSTREPGANRLLLNPSTPAYNSSNQSPSIFERLILNILRRIRENWIFKRLFAANTASTADISDSEASSSDDNG